MFVELDRGETSLRVDEARARHVPRASPQRDGGEVAVGMRPEHFAPAERSRPDQVWQGREVTLVEMLGSEMLVHFKTDVAPDRLRGHARGDRRRRGVRGPQASGRDGRPDLHRPLRARARRRRSAISATSASRPSTSTSSTPRPGRRCAEPRAAVVRRQRVRGPPTTRTDASRPTTRRYDGGAQQGRGRWRHVAAGRGDRARRDRRACGGGDDGGEQRRRWRRRRRRLAPSRSSAPSPATRRSVQRLLDDFARGVRDRRRVRRARTTSTTLIRSRVAGRQPARHRALPAAGSAADLRRATRSPLDEAIDLGGARGDPRSRASSSQRTAEDGKVYGAPMRMAVKCSSGTRCPSSRTPATRCRRPTRSCSSSQAADHRRRQHPVVHRLRVRRRRPAGSRTDWIEEFDAPHRTAPRSTTSGSRTSSRSTAPEVVEAVRGVRRDRRSPKARSLGGRRARSRTPFGDAVDPDVRRPAGLLPAPAGQLHHRLLARRRAARTCRPTSASSPCPGTTGGSTGTPLLGGGDIAAMFNERRGHASARAWSS